MHQIVGSLASNDNRFPGQWYQLESGLHYNWHRHYDPTLGRYTQPDPLGLVDGPNRYAYALNSPAMYIDPRGENAATWGARFALAGGASAIDGPLPFGVAVGLCILGYTAIEFGWDYYINYNKNGKYTGHGEDPEGQTGKGSSWDKHSGKRSGQRYGGPRNSNRGKKNKKYQKPKNPNKRD